MSAPAKLNLFLEVVGLRGDGYHELETVMQTIGLSDTVVLDAGDGLSLRCPMLPDVPAESNLAYRAAALLRERLGEARGVRMTLHKRIPAGAGLGGGSSDAAAVLKGLCRLWNRPLPTAELADLAASLGSDVPFFLTGGTALCRGRGELVTPLAAPGPWHYLLAIPGQPNNTAEVYRRFDRLGSYQVVDGGGAVKALEAHNAEALRNALFNRLQAAGAEINPQVRHCLDVLGGGAQMTGSGSVCFKLCANQAECAAEARRAAPLLEGAAVTSASSERASP